MQMRSINWELLIEKNFSVMKYQEIRWFYIRKVYFDYKNIKYQYEHWNDFISFLPKNQKNQKIIVAK